jgi:hypothetical protein
VALAGHDHVVVAVEPHLGRAAGVAGGKRRETGPLRRLGLLAAEGAAHAPADAFDLGIRNAEHPGHQMLDLGGVLGRGVHQHSHLHPGMASATWPSR